MTCSCSVCKLSVQLYKLSQVFGLSQFIVFPCLKSSGCCNLKRIFNFDSDEDIFNYVQRVFERYLTYGPASYDLLADDEFPGCISFRVIRDTAFCLKPGCRRALSYCELTYQNILLLNSRFNFCIDGEPVSSPLADFKECHEGHKTIGKYVCCTGSYFYYLRTPISHYDHVEILCEGEEAIRLVNSLEIHKFHGRKRVIRSLRNKRVVILVKPKGTGFKQAVRSFRLSTHVSENRIRLNLDKLPP